MMMLMTRRRCHGKFRGASSTYPYLECSQGIRKRLFFFPALKLSGYHLLLRSVPMLALVGSLSHGNLWACRIKYLGGE
jgi:hypothetical protein